MFQQKSFNANEKDGLRDREKDKLSDWDHENLF